MPAKYIEDDLQKVIIEAIIQKFASEVPNLTQNANKKRVE